MQTTAPSPFTAAWISPAGCRCPVGSLGCPNFASKKVSLQSETKQNANGFASFSQNSGKKISLQKFRFVSLKNMFRFKVSLREQFRFKSFASFRSTVVSTLSYYALFYNSVYITLVCSVLQ